MQPSDPPEIQTTLAGKAPEGIQLAPGEQASIPQAASDGDGGNEDSDGKGDGNGLRRQDATEETRAAFQMLQASVMENAQVSGPVAAFSGSRENDRTLLTLCKIDKSSLCIVRLDFKFEAFPRRSSFVIS